MWQFVLMQMLLLVVAFVFYFTGNDVTAGALGLISAGFGIAFLIDDKGIA